MEHLSNEIFSTIENNYVLRNAVAFAHEYTKNGKHQGFIAICGHDKFLVDSHQIEIAKSFLLKAKQETLTKYSDHLIFFGMGSTFSVNSEELIDNYRIRSYFTNDHGNHYMLELTPCATVPGVFVCFAIDITEERKHQKIVQRLYERWKPLKLRDKNYKAYKYEYQSQRDRQHFYHYNGLTSKILDIPYTKAAVLELVNREFKCSFQKLFLDNLTLNCDDLKSKLI